MQDCNYGTWTTTLHPHIIHQARTLDDYGASSTIWYDTFFTGNLLHSTATFLNASRVVRPSHHSRRSR